MRTETTVVVNRPIEEVWAFLMDPFNLPRVGGSWLGARWTSPGPPGLGSTYQGRVAILGFETRISGAIAEWDPPHSAALSRQARESGRVPFAGPWRPPPMGPKS